MLGEYEHVKAHEWGTMAARGSQKSWWTWEPSHKMVP